MGFFVPEAATTSFTYSTPLELHKLLLNHNTATRKHPHRCTRLTMDSSMHAPARVLANMPAIGTRVTIVLASGLR